MLFQKRLQALTRRSGKKPCNRQTTMATDRQNQNRKRQRPLCRVKTGSSCDQKLCKEESASPPGSENSCLPSLHSRRFKKNFTQPKIDAVVFSYRKDARGATRAGSAAGNEAHAWIDRGFARSILIRSAFFSFLSRKNF